MAFPDGLQISTYRTLSVKHLGFRVSVRWPTYNAAHSNLRVLFVLPISKLRVNPYLLLRNGDSPSEAPLFDGIIGAARGLGIVVCVTGIYLSALPHRADCAFCAIVAAHNPTGSRSMEPDTLGQQPDLSELTEEASGAVAPVEARISDADKARSEQNILQWMSYLPEDCVKTMIEMGWDVTT
jgi:hypothetical protein